MSTKNTFDKIKKVFTWSFVSVGLILTIIGSVELLNLGLKTYVFTKADFNNCYVPVAQVVIKTPNVVSADEQNYKVCRDSQDSQRQRDEAQASALLLVGIPTFVGFYSQTKKFN